MSWVLIALAFFSLIEGLIWWAPFWRHRQLLAWSAAAIQVILAILLLSLSFSLWTVLIAVIGGYRIISLARLIKNRAETDYLYSASQISYCWLVLGQALLVLGWGLSSYYAIDWLIWLYILLTLDIAAILILAASTHRQIGKVSPPKLNQHYTQDDLPSISVLIPARNETLDLEQCLTSLVESNYPKLEILVLDDRSQDKRTPEIIRSFAQAGVRFIKGSVPPANWLPKNYAYQQLISQASGEIVVFCGVDARFSADTLTVLVQTLLEKHKTMVSVMPVNQLSTGKLGIASVLVQPGRYAWELTPPRRLLNRPPVLSTCWLIYASKLHDFGGFEAVRQDVLPERYFAECAIKSEDSYSFIRSSHSLIGLISHKSFSEQRETAIRTRYLQLHHKLELVSLLSLLELSALTVPIIGVIAGIISGHYLMVILALLGLAGLTYIYGLICRLTYSKPILQGYCFWPLAVVYDIGLLNYSMWQYEFGQVTWKGRVINGPEH